MEEMEIKTGPAGSIRDEKVDMAKATTEKAAKETSEAKMLSPEKGQVLYEKPGDPVFNCFATDGEPINFAGGRFVSGREEDIKALDYFVKKKVLKIVEDRR